MSTSSGPDTIYLNDNIHDLPQWQQTRFTAMTTDTIYLNDNTHVSYQIVE